MIILVVMMVTSAITVVRHWWTRIRLIFGTNTGIRTRALVYWHWRAVLGGGRTGQIGLRMLILLLVKLLMLVELLLLLRMMMLLLVDHLGTAILRGGECRGIVEMHLLLLLLLLLMMKLLLLLLLKMT